MRVKGPKENEEKEKGETKEKQLVRRQENKKWEGLDIKRKSSGKTE